MQGGPKNQGQNPIYKGEITLVTNLFQANYIGVSYFTPFISLVFLGPPCGCVGKNPSKLSRVNNETQMLHKTGIFYLDLP